MTDLLWNSVPALILAILLVIRYYYYKSNGPELVMNQRFGEVENRVKKLEIPPKYVRGARISWHHTDMPKDRDVIVTGLRMSGGIWYYTCVDLSDGQVAILTHNELKVKK